MYCHKWNLVNKGQERPYTVFPCVLSIHIMQNILINQTVAVQSNGASRLAKKYSFKYGTPGMHFELFSLKKKATVTQQKITTSETIMLHEDHEDCLLRSFFLKHVKYQDNVRFSSLCLASENAFLSYLYSKYGHNSVKNYIIGIKFKLTLKTTCKRLS